MDLLSVMVTVIPIIAILTIVLGGALWIWMLIDAIKRDFDGDNMKVIWLLVIVLGQVVGAIVYYFAVKRKSSSK